MTLWQPIRHEKVPIPGVALGNTTINNNAMKKQENNIIPIGNFEALSGTVITSGFLSMLFHHIFFMYR
jgi:hypothetical protein